MSMKFKWLIDTITVGGAVLGSSLIAFNTEYSKYGFIFFFASSVTSIYIMLRSNTPKSILTTQIFFLTMNVTGIIRWFF